MPCLLPFELQSKVLGYIASNNWGFKERTQILASCCLVCKIWCHICQKELSRISLRTYDQLESLVTTLSSSTHPISTHITELSLDTPEGEDEPFYHVPLLYLAMKLPSLRRLVVNGSDQPSTTLQDGARYVYLGHSSVVMQLKHFRTVTEFSLSNITFQSFWEFRRVIVALPALQRLHIGWVGLPDSDPFQMPHGSVPSLLSAPRNLTRLLVEISEQWNPLWIWVTPSQTRQRELRNAYLRPFLTPRDAEILQKLVTNNAMIFEGTFDWSFNEEHKRCKSITSWPLDRREIF